MLAQAETPVILADHSKFDVIGQVVMPTCRPGTVLVSDEQPSDEIMSALENTRIEIAT
jgi:DeoR family transcriptional regulator, glycerol-3-phosphate regulon repressor